MPRGELLLVFGWTTRVLAGTVVPFWTWRRR